MNRIERFTGKLKRSEAMLSKALPTTKGYTLVKTDETLDHIRRLIQAS